LNVIGPLPAGGAGRLTITGNEQAALLPLPSVALQVTVVVPMGNRLPDGGAQVTVGVSQLSVAVAVKVTTAPDALVAATVMFAGQMMLGGVVSTTVTVVVHIAELPARSVAVNLTVCVPGPNVAGSGGLLVMVTFDWPQLSVAVAI
jgi:hypothetical protein